MAVAACVLEVLHPKAGSAAGAGPEVKSEEGGDKAAGAGAAGAGAPPPRKKQRSMFDFVKSPAAGTSGSSGAGAATAGAVSGASGAGEGAPKEASYVLVKRPEGGLLAGLWEFPGGLGLRFENGWGLLVTRKGLLGACCAAPCPCATPHACNQHGTRAS